MSFHTAHYLSPATPFLQLPRATGILAGRGLVVDHGYPRVPGQLLSAVRRPDRTELNV